MDPLKEAFQKIKQDIESLQSQISYLQNNLYKTNEYIEQLTSHLNQINQNFNIQQSKINEVKQEISSRDQDLNNLKDFQTNQQDFLSQIDQKLDKLLLDRQTDTSTHNSTQNNENTANQTHNSTDDSNFKPLNDQNLGISTGNEGVPADRQTNRQTNRQTQKPFVEDAVNILNSLDSMKKEVRLKFKRLTEQEFIVFSTIYQLSEENSFTDYKEVSKKTGLTESSIRDYVQRLIKKEIPVDKTKINNKNIQLSISENLKKIATLPTILQLRGI